tara:strand:- start:136 stop:294 length:159 start_codon:yes stop_codon:yes gene_type:complete
MKNKKKYIIESKGFNYAKNSIEDKKQQIKEMLEAMAKKYNISIEDIKKKLED